MVDLKHPLYQIDSKTRQYATTTATALKLMELSVVSFC